jgi:ABC-type sugar transport system substrate-binding protein
MERTVATREYDTWIYLDNTKATADLADAIGKKLGGKGVVVETEGAIGSSPQILRKTGFAEALAAKYPDIKVKFTAPTDYSRGQGYKVALDFLQANKDQPIDAWYTHYTEIGFGVAQALKDNNRTDIPQFSIVDGKKAVASVQDGTFFAIAPWTPVHGDVAFRAAVYHLTGQEVPKNISLVQPPLITAENAADVLQQTWPG